VNIKQNIQDSGQEETRARIVASARELFRQFGYAKTAMQDIARTSGMSAANLYRFYESKLAIGCAVAVAERTTLLAVCDAAVATAGPRVSDRLIALFRANIDTVRRKMKRTPMLFELDLAVAREHQKLRRELLDLIETRIVAILAGEAGPGSLANAAVKVRSRMILLASAPFILPWMLANEPFGDPRAMVEPIVRALVAGLDDGQSIPAPAARSPA
jgi:AcrR family transcriptional regulator